MAAGRHFIVGTPPEGPSCCLLVAAAPLLEEERYAVVATQLFDLSNPLRWHHSRTRTALTTNNRPIYVAHIRFSYATNQGLKGDESHSSWRGTEILNSV
jgi:hypothetical protein